MGFIIDFVPFIMKFKHVLHIEINITNNVCFVLFKLKGGKGTELVLYRIKVQISKIIRSRRYY